MKTYKFQVYKSVLVRDGAVHLDQPLTREQIRSSQNAARLLAAYLRDADVEHFVVIWLNQKYKIIGLRTVAIGSLTAAVVHPREVFIGTSDGRVAHMILAHNHPSGDPNPSKEDCAITRRLVEAGELLGITIIDHIIVAYDCNSVHTYYSFADNNCLTTGA